MKNKSTYLAESFADMTIEKGVPLPKGRRERKFGFTATLLKMEVGDSVFIQNADQEKPTSARIQSNASARCYQVTRAHPAYQFTVRIVVGGFRIWRIEPKDAAPADTRAEMRKILKDLTTNLKLESKSVWPELWDIVEAAKKAIKE